MHKRYVIRIRSVSILLVVATVSWCGFAAVGQQATGANSQSEQNNNHTFLATKRSIVAGSRVFIPPMKDGFETFLTAGIVKKHVPLVVVTSREKADYEITGISDSEKAGWAKMLFLGSAQSREEASIKVVEIKSGEVVFAYSVNKGNSMRGKQSAGEACAKHLKESIGASHDWQFKSEPSGEKHERN